ncbi:TetR/AcrR family transcriptional regulator [Actinocorallia sp. A-T 12471]|uniref:TetR/AcrR family transcriptional regulator n=1 Tax=Actinocorallia sp. A-T 12471 TaxID=3089813 RepID=UPI0029D06DA1|nr:TetR/AcrR family transcriptional regulator [Actinocorallia sp. A-T 12471]MDX6739845.1 TetR/AcrR family transcriptional regulator [Actinocorallia sp. A-T 12471]
MAPPARDARTRVLDTATRLFYAEGVHTVGIDRIIAEAEVAKATFYHHFKSKDALVGAYLTEQYQLQRAGFAAMPGDGAAKIELIFTRIAEVSSLPGFRGCPFLNAAAEFADPEHPVREVVAEYRVWFECLMRDLLAEAGHRDPAGGARLLLLLRDAAAVSGALDPPGRTRETVGAALRGLLTA